MRRSPTPQQAEPRKLALETGTRSCPRSRQLEAGSWKLETGSRSARQLDHVVVVVDPPVVERAEQHLDRVEQLLGTGADRRLLRAGVETEDAPLVEEEGADERAVRVDRHRADVGVETQPQVAGEEILLD